MRSEGRSREPQRPRGRAGSTVRSRAPSPAAVLVSVLIAGTAAGAAREGPPRAWIPNHEFQVEIGGSVSQEARLFQSGGTSHMLVTAPEFTHPLVIRVTEREIVTLAPGAVVPGPGEEEVQVDESQVAGSPMPFTRDASGVVFFLDGKRVRVGRRPPLIGSTSLEEILSHSPHYRAGMEAYTPSPDDVARLRSIPFPVEVQVFFGTWCPHCRETVPRFFKCLAEAANARIQMSCTGVPTPPFGDFPPAKEKHVNGVPTFIVSVEGKEIGRIQTIPAGSSVEHELVKILSDFQPNRS